MRTRFAGMIGTGRGTRVFATVLTACVIGGAAMMTVAADRPEARAAAPASPIKPRPKPVAVAAPAPPPHENGYVIKSVLKIDGAMKQGEYHWDESAAPAAGPVIVTVDLFAQTVSIFRGGHEIGTAVIVYGSDTTPTPLGIFPITQKDATHVSNLYDAPMPYMLRLTNDGISIHGSQVGDGYVTHGCIGVPTAFAKKIFGAVKLGDKVIVTRGERLDTGQAITAGKKPATI